MQKIVTPRLEEEAAAALKLYDHSDKYQFGLAIEEILTDMLKTSGGDVYGGAILELAASSMGSDTQLERKAPGRNNYVIDRLVSLSWHTKGFYENALKKNKEAIKTIEASTFPNGEAKATTLAASLRHIAGNYNKLDQPIEMIAYEKAAIELGGRTSDDIFVCGGFFRLKAYNDAIQTCTESIAHDASNMQALFWRGRAHQELGQLDAALQDLTAVADSEDDFRSSAAISLSMVYFKQEKNTDALNALNKYTYLYDPEITSRTNIAVSYNNRCYAYMQLGHLQKALDDCNASLKFGSLPDAIRKQRELTKRIGAGETNL